MDLPTTLLPKPSQRPYKYRSSWEEQYARYLEYRKISSEIIDYSYEIVKLRISDTGLYTPDFLVWDADELQFHEVKGMRREAGMVRLRTAAHQVRWARFFLVTKNKNKWKIEEVK